MVKHKLIHILQNLSLEEWTSLRKFVLMYTKDSSESYRLFSTLRKRIQGIEKNEDLYKINQEQFSQMSAKAFSNVMSKLTGWTENWIVYQSTLTNENEKDIALTKYYNRNGLYKEADAIVQKVEKRLNPNKQINSDKNKYLADLYYYHYYSDNPVKFDKSRDLLRDLVSNFHLSVKNKMQIYNIELHSWGTLTNRNYKDIQSKSESIISTLPNSDCTDPLLLLEELIKENSLEKFNKVKEFIESDQLIMGSDLHIIMTMYMIAKSHSVYQRQINNNQIVLDAYNYGLSTGVLLQSGKLNVYRFFDLIGIIAVNGFYENTINFIDRWYTKVKTFDNESIKNLAYATVCIYFESESEIAEHLNKVVHVDNQIVYKRQALTTIALYDDRHNNYDAFTNYINNFERNLKRNESKVIQNTYNIYYNFVKLMKILGESEFNSTDLSTIQVRPNIYNSWIIKEIKKRTTKN